MKVVLLDTNVLIDYLRGKQAAIDFVETLEETPCTSAIVVAELYAGVRDGKERAELQTLVSFTIVQPLSAATAEQGGLYRRRFGKSHNVSLEDALIAATANQIGATLVTLNRKHFPMLTEIVVPYDS